MCTELIRQLKHSPGGWADLEPRGFWLTAKGRVVGLALLANGCRNFMGASYRDFPLLIRAGRALLAGPVSSSPGPRWIYSGVYHVGEPLSWVEKAATYLAGAIFHRVFGTLNMLLYAQMHADPAAQSDASSPQTAVDARDHALMELMDAISTLVPTQAMVIQMCSCLPSAAGSLAEAPDVVRYIDCLELMRQYPLASTALARMLLVPAALRARTLGMTRDLSVAPSEPLVPMATLLTSPNTFLQCLAIPGNQQTPCWPDLVADAVDTMATLPHDFISLALGSHELHLDTAALHSQGSRVLCGLLRAAIKACFERRNGHRFFMLRGDDSYMLSLCDRCLVALQNGQESRECDPLWFAGVPVISLSSVLEKALFVYFSDIRSEHASTTGLFWSFLPWQGRNRARQILAAMMPCHYTPLDNGALVENIDWLRSCRNNAMRHFKACVRSATDVQGILRQVAQWSQWLLGEYPTLGLTAADRVEATAALFRAQGHLPLTEPCDWQCAVCLGQHPPAETGDGREQGSLGRGFGPAPGMAYDLVERDFSGPIMSNLLSMATWMPQAQASATMTVMPPGSVQAPGESRHNGPYPTDFFNDSVMDPDPMMSAQIELHGHERQLGPPFIDRDDGHPGGQSDVNPSHVQEEASVFTLTGPASRFDFHARLPFLLAVEPPGQRYDGSPVFAALQTDEMGPGQMALPPLLPAAAEGELLAARALDAGLGAATDAPTAAHALGAVDGPAEAYHTNGSADTPAALSWEDCGPVITLPCRHTFHCKCLTRLVELPAGGHAPREFRCPVCRCPWALSSGSTLGSVPNVPAPS
jgi:hypothetical protein